MLAKRFEFVDEYDFQLEQSALLFDASRHVHRPIRPVEQYPQGHFDIGREHSHSGQLIYRANRPLTIAVLKQVYRCELIAGDSHRLREAGD